MNQRGQVIIFLLLFIPPLLFLLFSVANTTLLVRDRIKLQNSADATVLSAGAWQAKGLNQVAEANAVIAAIDLMKEATRKGRAPASAVKARLLILDAEKRRLDYLKADVLKRIPRYSFQSAVASGTMTLTGRNEPNAQDDDLGAAVFGKERKLQLRLNADGGVSLQDNVLFGIAWRKRPLVGFTSHLFESFASPPAFALASAGLHSAGNGPHTPILVPDFYPTLIKIIFKPDDFDYLRNNYFFVVKDMQYNDLAPNLLH